MYACINEYYLDAIAMNKGLCYKRTFDINILNFVRSNVFSL